MTAVDDEQMGALLATLKEYTIVILTDGSRPDHPDHDAIVWEHGRRNIALMRDGIMPLVCPVQDDSPVHGFCVLVGDRDEASTLMDGDPGVQAGIFSYTLHPCVGFPGSTLP